jgi:hypothetical protein
MSFEGFDPKRDKKELPPEMVVGPEEIRHLTAQLEKEAYAFREEHPEVALWLYDHLNKINPRGLNAAFKNVIESVHGTFDEERVVSTERTYIVGRSDDAEAAHYVGTGITAINGLSFAQYEHKKMPIAWKTAILLDLVCHENAHATGKISFELTPDVMRTNVGYSADIQTESHKYTVASLFNEGVTELVSQRVAREYLIGYPMILEDGSILDIEAYDRFLESYHIELGTPISYAAARDFVRALSRHIAQTLSTTSELVEDAFVAGYFRGTEEYFDNPDFLDGVVGPGFSAQMRAAATAEDLQRIVREYEMPPITSLVQEKIEATLAQFAKAR